MQLIQGNTCHDIWRQGVEALNSTRGNEIYHLLLHSTDPTTLPDNWHMIYNPKTLMGDSLKDVVNTIFPISLYTRSANRQEFYELYKERHARRSRLAGRKKDAWGTYFLRLISLGEKEVNQLEDAVLKLGQWRSKTRMPFYFHISSAEIDSFRPLGGPCLQYIQLITHADRIDMAAVYRNHDYFNKALGNFIGLGQLLNFICNESGRQPGTLTCHSMHAYYDTSKRDMERLIGQ